MADSTSLLLVHLIWPVANAAETPLTAEALARLASYVPRYAETLGAKAHAVGGVADHLHVLLDLPPDKSLRGVEDELRRATQRFVRDTLGDRLFAWADSGAAFASVSPSERDAVVEYVTGQAERHAASGLRSEWEASPPEAAEAAAEPDGEEIPEWLRSALRKGPSSGR